MYFGPGRLVVTADVSFESGLQTAEIDDAISAIEAELKELDSSVKTVYIEPETRNDDASTA